MITIKNYQLDPELFYDPQSHLWIKVEGSRARIGIDPLEQETKGAFVVVQFESPGKQVSRGETFGSLEAEKHVGALTCPVSGKIVAINEAVVKNPRLANTDPFGEGWFLEIEMSDFEKEREQLITGELAIRQWYEAEIKKYEDWGWLAES